MSKEAAFLTSLVFCLLVGSLLDTGTPDGIFVAVTIGFFALCIAYAEWCERL